ncbi:MAG: sigma-70 family RNA polymerase sigma factor [Planctomycetes bacterium]|nr:sigma-70 family RNA polymerase sigma factor [Planctomycetota bacterium]
MSPGSKGNEAVQELFGRHADGLYRFAYEFLGTEQEAEDVLQESFLVALRHGSVMDTLNNPRAWLFTVALNLCRQRYKKNFQDRIAKKNLGTRAAASGCPGERMALHEAIQMLPPDHRVLRSAVQPIDYRAAPLARIGP